MRWPALFPWLANIALGLLFGISLCKAHNIGVSYASIEIGDKQVRWLVRLPIPELDLLLELDRNHECKVDGPEVEQQQERLRAYFAAHVQVWENETLLSPEIGAVTLWYDTGGHPFAETQMRFAAPTASGEYRFQCDVLEDVVSGHQTLATITHGGRTEEFVFQQGKTYAVRERGALGAIAQFVRMGVLHIFTGYDHIAFLIGLMLIGGTFRNLIKIVTSFTVAHSITLALAALNIVVLPSRVVESGIALSIMYIALENLFFKSFDRRWMVTFFFGLVHGFGFAGALRELDLSRSHLGAALFSFNFGVEIGQICIVGLLLPLIWLSANKRYTPVLLKTESVVIFLLGSTWFYQRMLGR